MAKVVDSNVMRDLELDYAGAHKRVAELESAILWALGEHGHFEQRKEGQGAYWWRTELRKRCAALPNDQAQRPPPETPGRLQESLPNYPNRPTAQRGGG